MICHYSFTCHFRKDGYELNVSYNMTVLLSFAVIFCEHINMRTVNMNKHTIHINRFFYWLIYGKRHYNAKTMIVMRFKGSAVNRDNSICHRKSYAMCCFGYRLNIFNDAIGNTCAIVTNFNNDIIVSFKLSNC